MLYPAPSSFEQLDNVLIRKEYERLSDEIKATEQTKVITAAGGLGKSIFTAMLPELLGNECLTVIYDCFGNGTYRNRLKFRHRHQDALVQIANQLADIGYCEPLIPVDTDPDRISEAFQQRLSETVARFREMHAKGRLVIAIDAADNAEIAAEINGHLSFTSDLIQQGLPENCILVMLCRPERKYMLNPPKGIVELKLELFSVEEIEDYLSKYVPDICRDYAEEVHRLTNGNPRVMSIAIQESTTIHDILRRLGPKPTTAEEQVEILLKQASDRIFDQLSKTLSEEMNSLYCGLAVLPPDIPIQDLSTVTRVNEATIRSFISEMGAQIIITENHLHFRDEPTEHWFRTRYISDEKLLNEFISRIEPFTAKSIYLAAALPELYVQAGHFDKMIEVVLNGQYLPNTTQADIREVEYTRLKYAVRAAINTGRFKDLIGLGLLAGDKGEVHNRIYNLYQDNFDILHLFLSKEPMRELAYKGKLRGNWLGSDRIYSAMLLSGTENGQPESRVYLKSAEEFLQLYFDERKRTEKSYHHEKLDNNDIFAFILTTYNNWGLERTIPMILSWSPKWLVFELSRRLSSYLIDVSKIDEVYAFLNKVIDNIYCVLAIGLELDKIGITYDNSLLQCIIANEEIDSILMPQYYMLNAIEAAPMLSLITLCEKALVAGHNVMCQNIVDKIFSCIGPSDFFSDFENLKRGVVLRAIAVKIQLQPDFDFFSHEHFGNENKQHRTYGDKENIKGIFNSLYPWYSLRLKVMLGNCESVLEKTLECRSSTALSYESQYGRFNSIEKERYKVAADIFLKHEWSDESEASSYYNEVLAEESYSMPKDKVGLLRGLMRTSKFDAVIHTIETDIYQTIRRGFTEPYVKVEMLMLMVRSLLAYNLYDARSYFEEAIRENESFGDDLPSKWGAIANIARRASECHDNEHELAFRFIRAAEFVGEHVTREKYWDRNEAVKITTLLSPSQGFAAISRWRERGVGWIEEQLLYVIEALNEKGILSGPQTWGLSGFFPQNSEVVIDLAIEAIHLSDCDSKRREIAIQVNRIAGVQGFSKKDCERLHDVLSEIPYFDEPIYPGRELGKQTLSSSSTIDYITVAEIELLLDKWTYDGLESVNEAFKNVNSVKGLYSSNDFYWKSLFQKVPLPRYSDFLEDIIKLPKRDFWVIISVLHNIPESWKRRKGFDSFWVGFLKTIGMLYAPDLLSDFYRRSLERQCQWSENEWYHLYTGNMDAIKKINREFSSSEFYDLAAISSKIETTEKSHDFLDRALKMLEKDIDADFADGPPEGMVVVSEDFDESIAGFYKAALASPDCEVRWQAVHGLVRYGLTSESDQLEKTIKNLFSVDAKTFLGKDFRLYDLNFQLYLMIALQRIAIEKPQKLLGIKHIFMSYFDDGCTHGLIQFTVYKIIQLLDSCTDGIFSETELSTIRNKFYSPNPVIRVKSYYGMKRSEKYYFLMDSSATVHLAFDFDRYWLNSLEQMFNIPAKNLEKMIGNYIVRSMDVTLDKNGWIHDERNNIFRSSKYEGRTYISQGIHPAIENLSFYLSYHGMFIIAGMLLTREPLYISKEDDELMNPYLSWLEDSFLKRGDGFLLVDGRTPVPIKLPQWAKDHLNDAWLSGVDRQYLHDSFFVNSDVCVRGYWEYMANGYREIVIVDSALVSRHTVSSLLTTLGDLLPHDYYLGSNSHIHDSEEEPFNTEEWIVKGSIIPDLDQYDPWASGTRYPDYTIDESLIDGLYIRVNKLKTIWVNIEDGTVAAYSQNWVEDFGRYGKAYYCPCSRMISTEGLLKRLCDYTKKALVINVKIDRERIKDKYSNYEGRERHSFHAFKVIDSEGWWIDEE